MPDATRCMTAILLAAALGTSLAAGGHVRNRFDQLGKELGMKTLGALGPTNTQHALNAETLYADLLHEPELGSTREPERQRLGLLGELARTPCLIELYSQAPRLDELRICLTKHIAYTEERVRQARSRGLADAGGHAARDVWTWVISAGVPKTLLVQLAFRPAPETCRGVYVLGGILPDLV
jgi:hypothetical protein